MLTRAARQQSRHRLSRHVASSYEQLHLPWLCPAVTNHLEHHRHIATPPTPPSRPVARRHPATSDLVPSRRRLASAAAEPSHPASYDNYVPFAKAIDTASLPSLSEPWQYGSDPIKNPIRPQAKTLVDDVRFRTSHRYHIAGDTSEKFQHLYACIRARRLDRAAMIIRDIGDTLMPNMPELVNAHEQYLASMLERQMELPLKTRFIDIQKWLELDVRGRQTDPTGSMLSSVLKATLISLQGTQRDRAVRRYLAQAAELGPHVEEDMLASSVFTEQDITEILSLAPHSYERSHAQPGQPDLEPVVSHHTHQLQSDDLEPAAYADSQAPAASRTLPELRSTDQKGQGLAAVRTSLGSLPLLETLDPQSAEYKANAILVQESIEQNVVEAALERWRNEDQATQDNRARGAFTGQRLGTHVSKWIEKMKGFIEDDLRRAHDLDASPNVPPEMRDLVWVAPHLAVLKPEQIAAATVIAYMGKLVESATSKDIKGEALTISLRNMCLAIATNIQDELNMQATLGTWKNMLRNVPLPERRRRARQLMRYRARPSADAETSHSVDQLALVKMGVESRYKLGAIVLNWLVKAATIPHTKTDPVTGHTSTEVVQVLETGLAWRNGKRVGVLRSHEEMMARMKREPNHHYITKYLPMVVEPRPWKGLHDGAYLKAETKAVRTFESSTVQNDYLEVAEKRGDLKGIFRALDIIGKVPWRINGPLFEVMTEVWNTGEALAGFAPENPIEQTPPEPSREDKEAHRRWATIVRDTHNEVVGLHSQRCYQNAQLVVARSYRDTTFYCPHSVDFRGRAYPIPPYFNHMGADYVRSLFMFARGKPLGEEGLRWLKIHLANVYGFDKESLHDREQFAMDHLADVYDSAENSLAGKRWWLTAGDPWQCLAACMELKAALDSPVPAEYASHLPIQQDGSCNGLQHYAALGGDEIGAQQVNLVPGDKPADIYSSVADLVRGYIDKDAKKGLPEAQVMVGHLSRKVVKQPVMTNVYGVTFVGAAAQVAKQLHEILPKQSLDNNIDISRISRYVAKLIFKALGEMFNGAQAIQHWLGECAEKISTIITPQHMQRLREQLARDPTSEPGAERAEQELAGARKKRMKSKHDKYKDRQFQSGVIWTTPLGMPVVQPYRDNAVKMIQTSLMQITVAVSRTSDPVNKRKQLQGFPPNFIHSLDATHMMLSAMKCDEVGLQFASVHDSFWTHAADVPVMNRILRDAFVRMHSDDVIGRLREELVARYNGCIQWARIRETSAAGLALKQWYKEQKILAKSYRHSTVVHDEQVRLLLLEADRQQLLSSEDPAEQAKGQAMHTPASIIAEHGGLEAILAEEAAADATSRAEQEQADLAAALEAAGSPDLEPPSAEDVFDADRTVQTDVEDALDAAEHAATAESAKDKTASDARKALLKAQRKAKSRIHFWTPLEFPPAPSKGAFDVSQLKDSQYFFS